MQKPAALPDHFTEMQTAVLAFADLAVTVALIAALVAAVYQVLALHTRVPGRATAVLVAVFLLIGLANSAV